MCTCLNVTVSLSVSNCTWSWVFVLKWFQPGITKCIDRCFDNWLAAKSRAIFDPDRVEWKIKTINNEYDTTPFISSDQKIWTLSQNRFLSRIYSRLLSKFKSLLFHILIANARAYEVFLFSFRLTINQNTIGFFPLRSTRRISFVPFRSFLFTFVHILIFSEHQLVTSLSCITALSYALHQHERRVGIILLIGSLAKTRIE